MKGDYGQFQKAFKKKWYIQGFNARPLFLNAAAYSGMITKKFLGYGYSSFVFHYHRGYCEMGYLNSDLKRLWLIIKKKIAADSRYLEKIKGKQKNIIKKCEKAFKQIGNLDLKKINQSDLINLLRQTDKAFTDSLTIAHIIEPISIQIEKEFKNELLKTVGPVKEFNQYYSLLTTPGELSFFSQEEKELRALAGLPLDKRKRALIRHCHKYFWLRNSYAGPKYLNEDDFIKRLKGFKKEKRVNNIGRKNILIKKLKLKHSLKEKIKIIDFASVWQDERKADILRGITYLGKVVDELARRTRVRRDLLYYLGCREILNIKSLEDIKSFKEKLIARQRNTFILMQSEKEIISLPEDSQRILLLKQKLIKKQSKQNGAIHGSIANTGTAVGRVSICRGIESLSKVRQGDVLVTSMTRPEFMPALKKAVAVITDEGGITCHAAIVARELNIPAVIGTKIATKILRDGMMVEVKGNHGIVNIIG